MPYHLHRFTRPDSYYDPDDRPVVYRTVIHPKCGATIEDAEVYVSAGSTRGATRYEATCESCGVEWEWEEHPDE